jgi:hypothetical protein
VARILAVVFSGGHVHGQGMSNLVHVVNGDATSAEANEEELSIFGFFVWPISLGEGQRLSPQYAGRNIARVLVLKKPNFPNGR